MASSSSTAFIAYSDCHQGFQQYKGINSFRLSPGLPTIPASSFLSLHQKAHTECLRAKRNAPVVWALHPKTPTVTQKSWDELVLKNDTPVLVEFYARWCGPCQMVHRVIDEIAVEYQGKLECFVLNTDTDTLMAEEYDIKAVPVVLLFKNGRKHKRIAGTMPKEFYVAAIEKMLAS